MLQRVQISTISLFSIVLLVTGVLLSGCASFTNKIDATVDARAVEGAGQYKTYWLLPDMPGVLSKDLAFTEYRRYVDHLLKIEGYKLASSPEKADVVILLSYQVSPPKDHFYTENVPLIGQSGWLYGDDFDRFGNTIYVSQLRNQIVYFQNIRLEAYRAGPYLKDKSKEPLWDITTSTVENNSDLRQVFPYLLWSMHGYIGRDSKHQVLVTVLLTASPLSLHDNVLTK